MSKQHRDYRFRTLSVGLCLGVVVFAAAAFAQQSAWVDEINNSLNFYKTSYPGSNWEPYSQRL